MLLGIGTTKIQQRDQSSGLYLYVQGYISKGEGGLLPRGMTAMPGVASMHDWVEIERFSLQITTEM